MSSEDKEEEVNNDEDFVSSKTSSQMHVSVGQFNCEYVYYALLLVFLPAVDLALLVTVKRSFAAAAGEE